MLHSLLATARAARVLSAHANVPPVPQSAVGPNLLEAFQIITELGRNVLRKRLRVLARLEILLTVQKPNGDLELAGVLNDGHELFNLVGRELSRALVHVDFGLFANQVGKAAANAGNLAQTKHDIALAFHVRVENAQNVLKFRSLLQ